MPDSQQLQTFAKALYEIRVLLAGYLGNETHCDLSVRQAAHLAYAFHNEAEAVMTGRFDEPSNSFAMISAMDGMLNSSFSDKFQAPVVVPIPNLESEAQQASTLLKGKTVIKVLRPRVGEIGIQFEDGTRLFVDHTSTGVELSIT